MPGRVHPDTPTHSSTSGKPLAGFSATALPARVSVKASPLEIEDAPEQQRVLSLMAFRSPECAAYRGPRFPRSLRSAQSFPEFESRLDSDELSPRRRAAKRYLAPAPAPKRAHSYRRRAIVHTNAASGPAPPRNSSRTYAIAFQRVSRFQIVFQIAVLPWRCAGIRLTTASSMAPARS